MKHSKAPWETPGTDGESRVICYRFRERRRTIAHVYGPSASERDANAALMAASPRLFEVAKQILEESMDNDSPTVLSQEAWENLNGIVSLLEE